MCVKLNLTRGNALPARHLCNKQTFPIHLLLQGFHYCKKHTVFGCNIKNFRKSFAFFAKSAQVQLCRLGTSLT